MPNRSPGRRHRRYDPLLVLVYVAGYQRERPGLSPSQRYIQIDLGISAPSVVHNLLHRLERRGLLTIASNGQGRVADLTLTEEGHAAVAAYQARRSPSEPDAPDDAPEP